MADIKRVKIENQYYDIKDVFTRAMVANTFDSNLTYTIGDFCQYNDILYQCIKSCSGSWDYNNWEQITFTTAIKNINDTLEEVL